MQAITVRVRAAGSDGRRKAEPAVEASRTIIRIVPDSPTEAGTQ
ncbi:hypothetical protein OG552_00590 [Streptomyces sp. NBC_01476]|nr:hypothetical protein [Streptomyces sp. NBC_01476]